MTKVFEEFQWRGCIHDATPEISEGKLGEEPLVAYGGFGPTSTSLHLASLIPIIGSIRLQKAGEIISGLSRFLLCDAMKRPQPQSQMGGIDVNYFPVREAVLQNVFCGEVVGMVVSGQKD